MISGIGNGAPLYSPQALKKEGKEELKVDQVGEVSNSKVQEIKEKVQNGEYKLDMQKTAERMVLNLLG